MAGFLEFISKNANSLSAGISTTMGLTKGILGAVQFGRANKELRGMKAPTYTRPDEVNEMVDLYRQRAAISQLPGQEAIESGLGATVAQGISDVQKSASSSVSALGAITDLYGKKQSAIRDLGIQFAEYKAARQAELGGALDKSAGYSDKEFEMNQWLPYNVKMNELMSRRQAGAANLFGGAESIGTAFNNLAGTQSYLEILKRLAPGNQPSAKPSQTPVEPLWRPPTPTLNIPTDFKIKR
jgi:hypothetical protein